MPNDDNADVKGMSEDLLLNSPAFARALLNNVKDAIIAMDRTGSVRPFNAGAQQMFGYISAEVMGKRLSMLVPDDLGEKGYSRNFINFLESGEGADTGIDSVLMGRRKNGDTFPYEPSSTAEVKTKRKICSA